ncbi:MAG: ATP-binding cassette domain-containing protein [Candidatus Melainabacteria bacterium]|nr:ATP-binding cassette domain-containing protein [Candidatus Melainabacteria bacterium]
MTSVPVVQVLDLKKNYGETQALKGVSFSIYPGEIFGIVGPDGAGKTSVFHMLGGILDATSGDITVLGKKPRDTRLEIGYLTQLFSLYLDLSINENIEYVAGLRQVSKNDLSERRDKYLKLMDLDRFSNRLAGQLSGGMKQKLALCCALIARPKLLLLDEPTTGVDPVSRREFWDLLASITQEGVTVAVATPYMDEAERCHRLILLHEGSIQDEGRPQELKDNLKLKRLELRSNDLEQLSNRLHTSIDKDQAHFTDIQEFGDRLDVLTDNLNIARSIIEKESVGLDLSISTQEPTLENVFVSKLKNVEVKETTIRFPFVQKGAPSNSTAIQAEHVYKEFGSFTAVKDVSLQIDYGHIYGLLGANGAGKTTTIKMLCGLLQPSKGQMSLGGEKGNLRSALLRKKLGYMSQKFTLYDDLTILENLEFYCGVYCVPQELKSKRLNWVLENTGLLGEENRLTGNLPGGWKQRLSFGAAVLHQPEVLFLDEPTSGVDPLARRQMWQLIRDFARQGTAILVTTHFLEEAEHCSELGFMVAGELVAQGAPGKIKAEQPGSLIELKFKDNQAAYNTLKAKLDSWRVSIFADAVHLVLDNPDIELESIIDNCNSQGIECFSSRRLPFSLEDAFIGIVKRQSTSKEEASAA